MKRFIHKDKISVIMTMLLLLFLILSNFIFSQPSFKEVSDLKINFGNGFTIENLYQKDSLLFVLMHRNYDLCAGIYNISDINIPVELGRQEKDEYRGNPYYKDYLTWSETLPCYLIKTDPQSGKANYLLMKHTSVLFQDSLVYEVIGYNSKINIYKISNRAQLNILKTISLLNKIAEVKNVSISNNVLYASARSSGILMLDLSDPLNPVEKILLEKADIIGHVTGGNRMLVGRDFSTLIAFDISDPWNPVQLKSLNYSHPIFDCAFDGKHFFISGHQSVSIFDNTAAKVNEVNTKGNLYELSAGPENLIIGTNIGFEIFNKQNISSITHVKDYGAALARPVSFIKNENLIYTVNQGDGLKIINISNVADPILEGELDLNGYARSIAVQNDHVYIADYINGLQIIKVSDPQNPVLVSSVHIPGNASDLDIINNHIYVLNDCSELFIINADDKHNPQIEFRTSLSAPMTSYTGEYNKIKAVGENIWVILHGLPLTAYRYENKNLTEVYKYSGEYTGYASEIVYEEPYLFVTGMNGIHIFDPVKFEYLKGPFGTNVATSTGSLAYDSVNHLLYEIQIHFTSFGIVSYDLTTPLNPVHNRDYYELSPGLEWLAEQIIYEDGFLYVLTQNGIKILMPQNTVDVHKDQVLQYSLEQNYPNPFNPVTTINYSIPEHSTVQLKVYDIIGREVAVLVDEQKPAGEHSIEFYASHLSSGIYIYKITASDFTQSRKLVLLK